MLRPLCWSWPPFVDAIGYVDPLLGCFVRCNLAGDTLLGVRAYSRAGATSGLAPSLAVNPVMDVCALRLC